jgi:diguanylate cyclase (GGDEF)-like protein
MSTTSSAAKKTKSPVANLGRQIQARINSLSYLPTTAAVAIKFVELGKDPDAEPADYAKVISADSSLSSKLLALANSSWAGVRTKVISVRTAVNLLGLGTVRTLAISYCMAGLHNELRLSPQESETFWESALSKAVAAKRYASLSNAKLGDEAFVVGLFQDFALPVMYAVEKRYLALLQDTHTDVETQLQKERELFGTDHTEVGRALAQKLELPELFIDTVAFHHSYGRLTEFVPSAPLREATHAAALLPHLLSGWNQQNADALTVFLNEHAPGTDMAHFVAEVQAEFAQLYGYFNEGKSPQVELTQLLCQSAQEAADNTTELVGTVNQLLKEAATMGAQMREQVKELEDKAKSDALTGVLNREGFDAKAKELLSMAARYAVPFAVCYLDIDKFKSVNDSRGHAFGDLVLKTVVAGMHAALPSGTLLGRVGGDEFVILLNSCGQQEAGNVIERLLAKVAATCTYEGERATHVSASAGLLCVKPSNHPHTTDTLIGAADKLMYLAKRAGGNHVEMRLI